MDDAGASTIASRILLTDGGWTLVEFASERDALEGAEKLREEVVHEIRANGEQGHVEIIPFSDGPSLVTRLASLRQADIAIVAHLNAMDAEQCQWLEFHRGALTNGPRIVFLASTEAAAQLCSAGNLLAWLGGRHYKFDRNEGVMDVETRLKALRELHDMVDETMVRLVTEKKLHRTPEIVEWLILIKQDALLDD